MIMNLDKEFPVRIMEAIVGLVALTIGGLIYIRYRSESLLMFTWFHDLDLSDYINEIRAYKSHNGLTSWMVFSMPAGLWLFSYLLIIDSIWGKETRLFYSYFILILPIAALTSELLQYLNVLPGTFDYLDMLSYVLATILFKILKLVV